jgi:uncharacterized protein with HEPN domain
LSRPSLAWPPRSSEKRRICEQLVEDLHGDPNSVSNDRVLAKAVLYDLHVIGDACGALPAELQLRHPEVNWKGWADFRNLTTHQYWRADATIAAEAMVLAIPMLAALVATELPGAAEGSRSGSVGTRANLVPGRGRRSAGHRRRGC